METTRRAVLAAAAATVTLPMLQAAVGKMRSAQAQAPATPAPTAQAQKPEPAGWVDTKLKPADLKADEFTLVPEHKIILTSDGKKVEAITNICTHRGCAIIPTPGAKILTCQCHKAQYNLDGTVAKAPATMPLAHYAVRLTAAGTVEVDAGTKVEKDAKDASVAAS